MSAARVIRRLALPVRQSGVLARPLGLLGLEIPSAALSDWLFWDHRAGLSFVLFCAALAAAAHIVRLNPPRPKRMFAIPILVLGLAPAVEDLNPLSVVFALVATASAAGLAVSPAMSVPRALAEAAICWIAGPRRICRDLGRRAVWLRRGKRGQARLQIPRHSHRLCDASGV